MERKVSTDRLKLGMYVAQLDRPWLESPFLFQGFRIESLEELERLRATCGYVYIDPELGEPATEYLPETRGAADPALARDVTATIAVYPDVSSFAEELPVARETRHSALELVNNVLDEVRSGGRISVSGVHATVNQMVDSIIRNPDAYMWLARMRQSDDYSYTHAIDSCGLAIAFARHMGLPMEQVRDIAVGTLLLDVGKMRLPAELLRREGPLSPAEFETVKLHVRHSVALMSETKAFTPRAVHVARTHHERHNGGGYPAGLEGAQIPVLGRMAAIIDCFDAITSERPYKRAVSPHEAVRRLYEWRDVDFQDELVEQFIQCLGVYPTGTVVRLSNDEVGIVLAQNRLRRLRPQVLIVGDGDHRTVDLLTETEDRDGRPLEIAEALRPEECGIDPREYFL